MADDVAVTVQFGADEPLVEFPAERVTVSVPLTTVGNRLYRLDGVPVFAESAAFGDVIEAEPGEGGRLRFDRVVEPGGWRTFDYILPAYKLGGEWAQYLLTQLIARGGRWERVFGGMLFVCIPPGLDLDPSPWVETVWRPAAEPHVRRMAWKAIREDCHARCARSPVLTGPTPGRRARRPGPEGRNGTAVLPDQGGDEVDLRR